MTKHLTITLFLMLLSLQAFATVPFKQVTIKDPRDNIYVDAYRGFSLAIIPTTEASTSETILFYLKNGSSNSYVARVLQQVYANTTASHTAVFNVYLNPTCSANGSAAAITNLHGNAAPAATTLTAFTGPTCSANGTLLGSFSAGNNSATTNMPIYLDPGNNLLVTVQVSNTSDKAQATWFWAED